MNSPSGAQRSLAATLRQAGAELQAQNPPAALQARVRAGVGAALRPPAAAPAGWRAGRRGGWHRRRWAWSGAAAFGCVLVGSAVLMLRLPAPAPQVDDGLRFGAFVTVAPPERWPRGPATAWLVDTELQGERLAAMGLPYDPARAGDSVRAELLLHPSGEVLAVRVLD